MPHRARAEPARLLKLPAGSIRVRSPRVGGAFGDKASLCPEDVALAWAATTPGCAVHWKAQRSEDFLAATHGRSGRLEAQAGFDTEGRLVALCAALQFDLGSWASFCALVPGWNAGRILPPEMSPGAKASPHALLDQALQGSHYAHARRRPLLKLSARQRLAVEQAFAASGLHLQRAAPEVA